MPAYYPPTPTIQDPLNLPIPKPSKPVKAALLGSGIFARTAYVPALKEVEGIEIVTLWSRSESGVKGVKEAVEKAGLPNVKSDLPTLHGDDGLESVLSNKDITACILVLPIGAQPELIRRCWAAGKHVISEKPVGRDVKQAKELVEEYEGKWKDKLVWRVAENYAHEPFIQYANTLLRDPSTGPVLLWRLHCETMLPDGASYHATTWRTVPDYQGGFILDGGVHWAALLRVVLPDQAAPAAIIAHKSLHRAHMLPHDTVMGMVLPSPKSTVAPYGAKTKVSNTLSPDAMPVEAGKSTPAGTFILTWALPDTDPATRSPNELVVVCEHATLRLSTVGRKWSIELAPGEGTKAKKVKIEAERSSIERELAEFACAVEDAVQGKGVQMGNADPRAALWDVAFVQAALDSDGKEVVIEDLLEKA